MVRNVEAEAVSRMVQPPQHITQAALAALDLQLAEAMLQKVANLGFNMSQVQSIDSAGLNWLLSAQNRLAQQGIHMVLHDPSPICLDVFVATRLEQRFKLATGTGQELRHA